MPDTTPAGTVPFTHDGVDWHIPTDLIAVQREFDQAEQECNRCVLAMDEEGYKTASTARMDAVLALYRHPWLREQMAAQHAKTLEATPPRFAADRTETTDA